jgi:chemotaxis protein MotB
MAKAPAAGKKGGGTKVIFIKKKSKGHGHHGGAWKVAYADFVTAMMALFMVLWLVSQTDSAAKSELSQYFRTGMFSGSGHVIGEGVPSTGIALDPGGGSPSMQDNEQHTLDQTVSQVESALNQAIGEDPSLAALRESIQVNVTDAGLLIQIVDGGADLIFDSSSASLKTPLVEFLQRLGPVLGQIPNQIQIHGHTDARPFGVRSTRSNWSLSFERADSARALLEQNGVRPGQVVGVLAHGETALLDPEHPEGAMNRRLSILAVRRGAEDQVSRGRAGGTGASPDVAEALGQIVPPGAPLGADQPPPATNPEVPPSATPSPHRESHD